MHSNFLSDKAKILGISYCIARASDTAETRGRVWSHIQRDLAERIVRLNG